MLPAAEAARSNSTGAASCRLHFATRCMQLIGGKRHAAPASASLKSGSPVNVDVRRSGIRLVARAAFANKNEARRTNISSTAHGMQGAARGVAGARKRSMVNRGVRSSIAQMRPVATWKMNTLERSLLALLLVAVLLSCIAAPFPQQMFLQHVPTAVLFVLLPLVARAKVLSSTAFACVIAFMLLHVVGARYIYSYVPYDAWAQRLVGISITEHFGFRRNHFDRVVHFAFGLLAVRPVWEILTRRFRVPVHFAFYASVEFVLAFSLVYELFEWGLTMILSPEDAGAYNGEQGDIWDAHRDMSLALLGSCIALVVWRAFSWRSPRTAA